MGQRPHDCADVAPVLTRRPEILMQREHAWSAAAFAAFHAATAPALWRYLRRVGGSPQVADDLLQESYLRFLHRPPEAMAHEVALRAYLFKIASRLLKDAWRKEKRERLGIARLLQLGGTTEGAAREESGGDLAAALSRLKPRERALLWLAHVEGYSHQEVAGMLQLAEASVRVLLFRARRRLALELERRSAPVRPSANEVRG